MMHEGWGNGGGWILGMLFMILFWGGIFWLVLTLVRRPDGSQMPPPQHPAQQARPSAADILAERLARGEIDVEDYERRRRALELH
jgi:putative membrane protein